MNELALFLWLLAFSDVSPIFMDEVAKEQPQTINWQTSETDCRTGRM